MSSLDHLWLMCADTERPYRLTARCGICGGTGTAFVHDGRTLISGKDDDCPDCGGIGEVEIFERDRLYAN